jgi:medium-chain acyl-[acyl-carrier-protein] hydrolase
VPTTAWLRESRPPAGACTLVCLPCAGGSANNFRSWQQYTTMLDVVAVELPGRAARFTEPVITSVDRVVDYLVPELDRLDRDYALFGHSLGGLIAFELGRRVRELGGRGPRALFVAGCPAPDVPIPPPLYDLPRPELLAWLTSIGGIDEEVIRTPQLLDVVLPTLRADLAMMDMYAHRAGAPLPWPIFVFAGDADPVVDPRDYLGWSAHTTAECQIETMVGSHFFIDEHVPEIIRRIEFAVLAVGERRR